MYDLICYQLEAVLGHHEAARLLGRLCNPSPHESDLYVGRNEKEKAGEGGYAPPISSLIAPGITTLSELLDPPPGRPPAPVDTAMHPRNAGK